MSNRFKRWAGLGFSALGMVLIVYLDGRMRGLGHPQLLGEMSYALALLTSFMTSFHCVGMCGALVLGYTTQDAALGRPAYLSHLWYGLGKTLSYTLIGAAFATLGGVVAFTSHLRGVIALGAGVFLILFGLRLLGVLRLRVQLRTPAFLLRLIGRQYRRRSHPFVIGLANGLMIVCGPLQAMYILAAGTGDPLQGGALLFLFGLGTLPMLFGFGVFATTLAKSAGPKLVKLSSIAVVVMGAVMLNRGLILTQSGYDLDSLISLAKQRWRAWITFPINSGFRPNTCANGRVRFSSLRGSERVSHLESFFDHLTVLQILGVQDITSSEQCRRDDQSIVHRETVAFRDLKAEIVRLQTQRLNSADQPDGSEHIANLSVRHAELADADGHKFVEYLNTDHAALADNRLGTIGFDFIP